MYIDTNVLVAYYATDEAEKEKKKLVEYAFSVLEQVAELELCTSQWAVTEMIKTLIKTKGMEPGAVAQIASTLLRGRRLQNLKISVIKVSPRKDYDFDDFFVGVGEDIITYRLDLADAIHSVIVKNHSVAQILSFDEELGLKEIPGCTVIHPRQIAESAPNWVGER